MRAVKTVQEFAATVYGTDCVVRVEIDELPAERGTRDVWGVPLDPDYAPTCDVLRAWIVRWSNPDAEVACVPPLAIRDVDSIESDDLDEYLLDRVVEMAL